MSSGNLSERVAKLERENRWMKVGLVGLIAALVFVGFTSQDSAVLEANRFVLVDSTGTQRGEWTFNEQGPMLRVGSVSSGAPYSVITPKRFVNFGSIDPLELAIMQGDYIQIQQGVGRQIRLQASPKDTIGRLGPRLEISSPSSGKSILGRVQLETESTGSVEMRPASSLVLFNESENVIWKAPR